jgi:hypothetical protein
MIFPTVRKSEKSLKKFLTQISPVIQRKFKKSFDGTHCGWYLILMMKITSDSAIKNQIAFQLKSIKTMESNASHLGMTELVKTFRQQRNSLTKAFNSLTGAPNSVKGIQYGERRARIAWLASKQNRRVDGTPIYTR